MIKRKAFLMIQALACIALAVCLSWAALSIYREGAARRALNPLESIYTPQIVAKKLTPVLPLMLATLGLAIAGRMLGIRDEDAGKPAKDAAAGRAGRPFAARAGNAGAVQAVLIAAAVLLIIAGVLNGSARDVLYKAITICTECVGLG